MQNPDTRPLPTGWTQDYNPAYQTWFYVDLGCNPPKSTYQHPLDQPPPLSSLTGQQPASLMPRPSPEGFSDQPLAGQASTSTAASPVLNILQPQVSQLSTRSTHPAAQLTHMQLPPPGQAFAPPAYTAPAMLYPTAESAAQLPTLTGYPTPMPHPTSTISLAGHGHQIGQAMYPVIHKSSGQRNDGLTDFETSLIKWVRKSQKICKKTAKTLRAEGGLVISFFVRMVVNIVSGMSPGDAVMAALASTTQLAPAQGGSFVARMLATAMARNANTQQPTPQIQMPVTTLPRNGNVQQPGQATPQAFDYMQALLSAAAQNDSAAQQPAPIQVAPHNYIMQVLLNAMAQNGTVPRQSAPEHAIPQGPDLLQMLSNLMAQNSLATQPTPVQTASQNPGPIQAPNAMARNSTVSQQSAPGQTIPQEFDLLQVLLNTIAMNGTDPQQSAPGQAAPQGPDLWQMPSNSMAQNSFSTQPTPAMQDFMHVLSNAMKQSSPAAQKQASQDFKPLQALMGAASQGGVTAPPQASAVLVKPESTQTPAQGPDYVQVPMNTMLQNGLLNQSAASSGSLPPAYPAVQFQNAQGQQNYLAAITALQQQRALASFSSTSSAGAPKKASAADMEAGDTLAAYLTQMQQYQQE
ncbi:hypothetical protein BD779DRAFT_486219 [Infundibulicybe gibba]|nr:hypothetical protein BD779DRAFT_486219 [Infundibulicybe gibba]